MFTKPTFSPAQAQYLERVFQDSMIFDPSDPMLTQKLLIREGCTMVIKAVKALTDQGTTMVRP